ncbi:MAG TPA: PHP domain-containing protein [Mycobacteriales bacterium]|nr:PHP domain-containing protein [Mycobacteriales bacterium]
MDQHHGPHSHDHGHDHDHSHDGPLPPHLDPTVADGELSPAELDRRTFLRRAGLAGAGVAATAALAGAGAGAGVAAAAPGPSRDGGSRSGGYLWLSGDHHIHTQYSPDAQYRVIDQVSHASQNGLDWMVITDHGSVAHAKFGVEKVNPDIRRARVAHPDTLVFQGFEWNIPAAEHATVFVAPGSNEVTVLKQFENAYDGVVRNAGPSTPANEALAIAGLGFLDRAVRTRQIGDALMLANHPARKGIDSPHEIRNWRDTAPAIAIGMEGAPGHQAAGIPAPAGPGGGRGEYDFSPSADSFPGYPPESYRTFGGFDWMTSTVGGLWDSLLAEGKTWWVTSNSDSHMVYADWAKNPVGNVTSAPWDAAGDTFDNVGRYGDPIYAGGIQTGNADFWPGYYSSTHVGAISRDYRAVMAGMRAGRIWVTHGNLIRGLEVRVRATGGDRDGVTLGGRLKVRRGATVEVSIKVTMAGTPNFAQFVPTLARVDMITGDVTGATPDRDTFSTPRTKVARSWDVNRSAGSVVLTHTFRNVRDPFYLRLRGTDGEQLAPGILGAGVDPSGPAIDVVGDADPWADLWFYSNPIWVLPPTSGH